MKRRPFDPTLELARITGLLEHEEEEKVKWWQYGTHLGFYSFHVIRCFFRHPLKKEKKDLELLEQVRSLLDVEAPQCRPY